eukprot:CAMPEP_0116864032 /NCGR_PEP_ID=MMETSP0418-20121206/24586_1 /TAXON_ID=1158023 /ORGANISM="Astrosyne radiata, Strain 13vi08-1A" /LENGTH=57 /DNA_ID=CAMNT_0004499187 /DNA_START=371 /DNA_END=544 /DNA_ORIENTATION=-
MRSFAQKEHLPNKTNWIAFQGLSPGDAADAKTARKHKRLSHAQMKRRDTTPSPFRKY